MKYGLEGYGLYWYCLELIAGEVSKENITFELDHDAEIIAHDTGLHYERVQEMMTYMVNLGLFEENQGVISCIKMAQRLDKSMTSNPAMRVIIDNLRNPNSDSHDGVMIPSEKVMQDKTRLDKNKTYTSPDKPDAKALRKARAIELMELWNQAKAEHDTNWTAVDDPAHTSAKRYTCATARAEYIRQRLKRSGKADDWDSIREWFSKFYTHLGKDDFYSGRPTERNPKGYKATFEQVHAEEYFVKAIERLTQGWKP